MTTQSITKSAAEPSATVAATGHADPTARAGALPRAHRLRARFRGACERERWGDGVRLFVGLMLSVPDVYYNLSAPSDGLHHVRRRRQAVALPQGRDCAMTELAVLASQPGGRRAGGRRAGTVRRARRGARPDHRIRSAGSGSAEHRRPVLTGYDGSNASRHALAYAAGMAQRLDGWLVVVHVWRGDGFVFVPPTERMRWLRTELTGADLTGLNVEIVVRYGLPARELRRVTAERGADAIVIGAPERFPHRFAGSVPAWLARHAECPVVIVP